MKNKYSTIQGLVAFLALLLLVVFIFWLSNSDFAFFSSYQLEVKFDSAGGLLYQGKVLLRGYRIGSVKSVRFEPDGVVVTLSINRKYRIPAGSTVEVISYNFIGERAVSITPSQSGEFLPPNSQIRGESRDIMADARSFFYDLRERLSSGRLENIERIALRLEDFIENVRPELSLSLPPQFEDDLRMLRETIKDIRLSFEESGGHITAMTSDVQAFVKKVNGLLEISERNQAQLEKILQQLSTPESSAGKFLQDRELWEMTKKTLENLNEFLRELRTNPKKYFKISIF